MFIKDNLKVVREMEEEYFGGVMEVDMRVTLKMEFNVDLVHYIEQTTQYNTKEHGAMECLMVKVFKPSKMEKDIKAVSNKINSMEMVYFIRMIQ